MRDTKACWPPIVFHLLSAASSLCEARGRRPQACLRESVFCAAERRRRPSHRDRQLRYLLDAAEGQEGARCAFKCRLGFPAYFRRAPLPARPSSLCKSSWKRWKREERNTRHRLESVQAAFTALIGRRAEKTSAGPGKTDFLE